MSANDAAPPSGVAVYGEYLKEQLAEEAGRKASFEQRGLAVVTTAGTLVTLLLGLAALSTSAAKSEQLSHAEKVWLGIGFVLFVLSAAAAVLTNLPRKYEVVETDAIEARLEETPVKDAEAARLDIAFTQVNCLKDAKAKNTWKGGLLFAALSCELLAVLCVGIALLEVVGP